MVPGGASRPEDVAAVGELARACGARPVELDAATHDRAVAAISHLPLVASLALADAALASADWPVARQLAAQGWRDMTRLARGDPAMGGGMLATNAPAVAERLRDLRAVLDEWQVRLDALAAATAATGADERAGRRGRPDRTAARRRRAPGRPLDPAEPAGPGARTMASKGLGVPDLLHLLSDPNLAFVLLVMGGLGLILEVVHPNFVTGTIGAISLVLAFIGLTNLPLDAAGLLFIGVGLVLFVLESSVPTHGFLTVGGLLCIAVGALTLYSAPPAGSTQPPVTRRRPRHRHRPGLLRRFHGRRPRGRPPGEPACRPARLRRHAAAGRVTRRGPPPARPARFRLRGRRGMVRSNQG